MIPAVSGSANKIHKEIEVAVEKKVAANLIPMKAHFVARNAEVDLKPNGKIQRPFVTIDKLKKTYTPYKPLEEKTTPEEAAYAKENCPAANPDSEQCRRFARDALKTIHYFEHFTDKDVNPEMKEENDGWKADVDMFTIGAGETLKVGGSRPTRATVITPKGMKDKINRKCMIYFPPTAGGDEALFLAARYAREADINMITVDYLAGETGWKGAVSIVRDIALEP